MGCLLSGRELERVLAAFRRRGGPSGRSSAATGEETDDPEVPRLEVIAVQREDRRLVVRTCTSYRRFFAAQAGSDYYELYVIIEQATVTEKRVACRRLFAYSTMYTENATHDDDAWVREMAARYLTF